MNNTPFRPDPLKDFRRALAVKALADFWISGDIA